MIQIIDYRSMIDLIYNEGSDGKYHLFNSVVRSISKTYGDLFEQKEKIRQIATGRKFSEETKKKLSKMRIGRKHKQESIEKMRNFSDKRMRDPITGRYIRRNNNND